MATPVILINSVTGSDTAASGAGPATALTGASASTDAAGTLVTLDGSPDLSGVAVDGSHVIWLNNTTAGARNFGAISAVDNTAKTVTVSNAFAASLTGKSWAIGGKRATLGHASTLRLVNNNTAAGDASGLGWTIEMQSGHAESFSADLNIYSAGSTSAGPLIIRGENNAATRPVITLTGGARLVPRNSYIRFAGFNITSNATGGNVIVDVGGPITYENLKVIGTASGSTLIGVSGSANVHILSCELVGGTTAIAPSQNTKIVGNYIHDIAGAGISFNGSITGLLIFANVIARAGGNGIVLTQGRADAYAAANILFNTIDSCTSNAISYTGLNAGLAALSILSNILSNNGGYGIDFGATATVANMAAYLAAIRNNDFYNNTSGAIRPADASALYNIDGVTTNPTFANAAGGDFSVGTNMKALAFPSRIGLLW